MNDNQFGLPIFAVGYIRRHLEQSYKNLLEGTNMTVIGGSSGKNCTVNVLSFVKLAHRPNSGAH